MFLVLNATYIKTSTIKAKNHKIKISENNIKI